MFGEITSLVFGILIVVCNKRVTPKPTLKAVFMLMRHGDRSPNYSYPADPHSSYRWPGGSGALSKKGEDQMLQSGCLAAGRFGSLLVRGSQGLDTNNICVLSSSAERCVKSIIKFLEGFLSDRWTKGLVKVIPEKDDEFLLVRGKPCGKYFSTFFDNCFFANTTVKNYLSTHGYDNQFFEYLEENTKLNITSLMEIYGLDDVLSIQQNNGLPLPKWTVPVFDKYIRPLAEFAYNQMCASKYMQIRSGVLLKDIIGRIDDFISNKSKQNIFLYCAHDITITAFLFCLEVKDQINLRPGYGSSVTLELHENTKFSNDYEVKLFYYQNYADENPIEIQIPNCEGPCSFQTFKKVMESKLTFNYDKVCRAVKKAH